jgi:hypothetical protein
MNDSDECRCPYCDSTDLVGIHTAAIANELVECRSCMRLYEIKNDASETSQLVPVQIRAHGNAKGRKSNHTHDGVTFDPNPFSQSSAGWSSENVCTVAPRFLAN